MSLKWNFCQNDGLIAAFFVPNVRIFCSIAMPENLLVIFGVFLNTVEWQSNRQTVPKNRLYLSCKKLKFPRVETENV